MSVQDRRYGERIDMKEVFQEYGGVIVTIVAVVALIAVITAVIGNGQDGDLVYDAFKGLIEGFFERAEMSLGGSK